MYVKIEDGQITEQVPNIRAKLKELYPHASIMRVIPDQIDGYTKVTGDPNPPEGQQVVSNVIELQGGAPVFVFTYEDIPEPEVDVLEVRLAALEEKVGVTEEEKLAAKEKIKLKARTK